MIENNGHTLLTPTAARLLLGVSDRTFRNIVHKYKHLTIAAYAIRGDRQYPRYYRQDVLALKAKRNPEAD